MQRLPKLVHEKARAVPRPTIIELLQKSHSKNWNNLTADLLSQSPVVDCCRCCQAGIRCRPPPGEESAPPGAPGGGPGRVATPRHSAEAATTQAAVPRWAAEAAKGAEAAAEAAAAALRLQSQRPYPKTGFNRCKNSLQHPPGPTAPSRAAAQCRGPPRCRPPPGRDSRGSDCGNTEASEVESRRQATCMPPWPEASPLPENRHAKCQILAPKVLRRREGAARALPGRHPRTHTNMKLQQVQGGEEGRRHDVEDLGLRWNQTRLLSDNETSDSRGPRGGKEGAVNRRQ